MAIEGSDAAFRARRAWVAHTAEALRRAGHRSSGPRMAVVEVLGRQDCVLTARAIADELRAEGRDVGTATVYRALERLDELGLVQRLDVRDGPALYEPADPSGEHHHHLVCDSCRQVSPFEDRGLERAIEEASDRLDFRVAGHDVVMRGICRSCARSASP